MNAALRVAFAAALAAAGGCGKSSDEVGTATVRDYFGAVSQKDCSELRALSGGKVAASFEKLGCTQVLEAYEHMGLQLVEINSEVEDGRNRDARIVRAVLAFEGKGPREVLLRVERSSGRWVLVSL